jgi:hypothetical protein
MSHEEHSPAPSFTALATPHHCNPPRTLSGHGSHQDKTHSTLQAKCLVAGRTSRVNGDSVTLTPVVSMCGMAEARLAEASTWV